jgi:ectoine hydroxylase-related dioxygenase (phytanoyl-CoA dioxygenase family)
MEMTDEEYNREYIIELVKNLALAFGPFYLLTELGGVDQEVAGALEIVGLSGYLAYLLFFDGGVTQAALQAEGVRQTILEEEDAMSKAPRAEIKEFSANEAASEPHVASSALEEEGYIRINKVLSPETTKQVLQHINAKHDDLKAKAKDDMAIQSKYFGDVLERNQRSDLFLDLDPVVRTSLEEAMTSIKPVFENLLGEDAELFELAAIVADPRAPRQPMHPDTVCREAQPADVATAYVALQDVEVDMGPTIVVPRSNTVDVHKSFNTPDDGGRQRVQLLRETPYHVGVLQNGDANLIDSRLIHCGGANESNKRRVLMYVSFKRASTIVRDGSLKFELRNAGIKLGNVEEWISDKDKLVA